MNPTYGLSEASSRCWVNWRFEERDGKPVKMPYSPSGRRASSTDETTWSTFAEVEAARDRFEGVGFVFNREHLGVDIDHCIIDGKVSPEIEAFIRKARTVTEVSPSGNGLHLYFKLTEPLELERNRSGNYEAYTSGRYFTVSGNEWTVSHPLRTITPDEALELLKELGYPWNKPASVSVPMQKPYATMGDAELLEKMFCSKNGGKIRALYDGNIAGYPSPSEADLALCSHLAYWTNGNAEQIERLWLASPLGARKKTQEREQYRREAIEKVLANQNYGNLRSLAAQSNPPPITSSPILTRLADVQSVPIEWLWPGRFALGKLSLISGDPGLGKSLVTVTMAAAISKGYPWPVDGVPAPIGDVILLSAEDDPADTIRPRLDAAGADTGRIHILEAVREIGADGKQTERMFSLQNDLAQLESSLSSLPECRLIVVDPISAYLGNADSHKNSDIRGLLAPLAKLAARRRVAVVVVSHLNKNAGGSAMYRTMGSLAFTAAARASYVVTKDRDNPLRRLVLPVKNNLAKDITGLAYTVLSNENNEPVIAWETEPVELSADEVLATSDAKEDRTETEWAVQFLEVELSKGPKSVADVAKEAKAAGVKDKALRMARKKLGVTTEKAGYEQGWVLTLPGHEKPAEDAHAQENAESTFPEAEMPTPEAYEEEPSPQGELNF